MKKAIKICVAVSVLLVMLTNISYSVTYSFCGMTATSKCACDMDSKNTQTGFKKISCCKEEVKNISNNADFTKLQETVQNPVVEAVNYVITLDKLLLKKETPGENLLFYPPGRDLPVKLSKLRI
ncbi:MAG: hypothetical protein L0Y76_05970 [Ignavibacteria bacterium]|nr:hypothetical protein [Ignavibacteria bacterium]